jgi:N-acetylmuramoyl-L-alanine amidase
MRMGVVLIFLLAALAAAAHPFPEHMERIGISGSDYIRIIDWSEGTGLGMNWDKRDETVTLNGPAGFLKFTIDSRKIEINGVNVWLSLPVVNRAGAPLLSVIDLSKTIEPILFPHKVTEPLKVICLDPGHGGKDSGETERHNYEKTYVMLLAEEVASLLKKEGLKVYLTRDHDEFIELPNRSLIARRHGADLFVSMHYNSLSDTSIRGLEVFCLTPAGMNSSNEGGGRGPRLPEPGNQHDDHNVLLAYEMQKAITRSVPLEDRGMKRSRFEVLREAAMPAILIEGGFMSNMSDARNIYDASFRKRMARAIVNGIMAYKKTVERL